MNPDLAGHLAQLRALARRHGLHTLVLRRPATLAWLLGARYHVPQTLDTACFDLVVDAERVTVVTNAIEAPRLRDTELAGLDAQWEVVPWWEPRDRALPHGAGVGGDRDGDVAGEIATLRRVLGPGQREQLRALCREAAEATTDAALLLEPGGTEQAAAAQLAHALLHRGLDPVVLLVAGDERIARHRHPLPTDRACHERIMLVCCARRHGLIASVTRIVAIRALSAAEEERYTALLRVEQGFLDVTRAGVPIGEIVATGVAGYAEHGFPADEWHRHHQGGFTGVQPREFPAHPGSTTEVPLGAAVAWNPGGGGWKVEDTCLVTEDGVEPLVRDPRWPSVRTGGRLRPGVLAPHHR